MESIVNVAIKSGNIILSRSLTWSRPFCGKGKNTAIKSRLEIHPGKKSFRYTVIWNKVIDEHLSLCYRYQNYKARYKFSFQTLGFHLNILKNVRRKANGIFQNSYVFHGNLQIAFSNVCSFGE